MKDLVAKYCGTFIQNKTSLISIFKGYTWNYVMQLFDYTRSYEDGLIFLSQLLEAVEKEKDLLSKKHYESHTGLIYWKMLSFLDKLDQWKEFLEAWDNISKDLRNKGFNVSLPHWRKECIERKLEKKKAGKYPGKLHEQQSELTQEEIKERFDWMVNFFKTGVYDMNPPASKQRKNRLEEKRKTIDMEPIDHQDKKSDR